MNDDLVIRRFLSADVARAAGVSLAVLNSWLARRLLDLADDPEAPSTGADFPGTGRPRLFSRRRARHIAVTAELVKLGVPIRLASGAALRFSDVANVPGSGRLDSDDPDWRAPGGVFRSGQTLMLVHGPLSEESVPPASVKRVEGGTIPLADLLYCGLPDTLPTSVIVVNVSAICDRVDRALVGLP